MSGTQLNRLLAASQPVGADPFQWLRLLWSQGTAPGADALWVENLKRLVQPNADPNMLLQPRYPNTDPGLIRLAPRVGDTENI